MSKDRTLVHVTMVTVAMVLLAQVSRHSYSETIQVSTLNIA